MKHPLDNKSLKGPKMASSDGTGKVYFSHAEWVEFIQDVAPFLKSTQFALGPITSNEDGYEVEYAFGDEVHPKDWLQPPPWLTVKAVR